MPPSAPYTMFDDAVHDAQTVLTVGFFDGVHVGHQSVLRQVAEEARHQNARPLAVTFDRPPRAVLLGTSVPLLTTLDEKAALIKGLGLADMVVIPFDRRFSQLEPEEFVKSILVDRIGLTKIVLGFNHRFGRNGAGDLDTMRTLGVKYGFEVATVEALRLNGIAVSSTGIREMLVDQGMVATAADLLGRYYTVDGVVVHGDGRGRTIGFPTANLRPIAPIKIVPLAGVYAVFVRIGNESTWRMGVMNIGVRPTVTEGVDLVSEVHVIGFDGDLYGVRIEIAFVDRLREEKKFTGLDALVSQISRDRDDCVKVLNAVPFPD